MSMGESVGLAAAWAAQRNVPLRALPPAELRRELAAYRAAPETEVPVRVAARAPRSGRAVRRPG